jgi:hypothetical protein
LQRESEKSRKLMEQMKEKIIALMKIVSQFEAIKVETDKKEEENR